MKTPPDLKNPYENIKQLAADLRNPDGGCPWDIEQNHKSLIENLIEESYEVAQAIEDLNPENPETYDDFKEELGDLFFQVVIHSQIASEKSFFNLDDVIKGILQKLIFRHPHVYTLDQKIENSTEVLKNWETLKRQEKQNKRKDDSGVFSSIPDQLPALLKAYRMGQKASRLNFDWKYPDGTEQLFDKINEEYKELLDELPKNPEEFRNPGGTQMEKQKNRATLEFGDLLFVISQLARHYHIDPEFALQQSNKKFKRRFSFMENVLKEKLDKHINPDLHEWEETWKLAKSSESDLD
jgi:MazG family protein